MDPLFEGRCCWMMVAAMSADLVRLFQLRVDGRRVDT